MKLSLCIATADSEIVADAIDHAAANAVEPFEILVFGNGGASWGPLVWNDLLMRLPEKDIHMFTQHSEENLGVPTALHRLYEMADKDLPGQSHILAYIHDDVRLLEKGWDVRVKKCFIERPNCGLAGFGGATALGGEEIYKAPYEIHQLGRRNFYSNMVGAELHGERRHEEMPIVFTDGFSMLLRRDLLDAIGGWSWWPPHLVHHAYDYGIACMNRRHGRDAWLIPCAVEHRGGLTATRAVHQDMAKKYGGDSQVHADAHRWVYENFRDVYPMKVR